MIEAIGYMFIGVFFASLFPALRAWAESKNKWVGLTDEEFNDAINDKLTPECIAIAIEAKLKEKNT